MKTISSLAPQEELKWAQEIQHAKTTTSLRDDFSIDHQFTLAGFLAHIDFSPGIVDWKKHFNDDRFTHHLLEFLKEFEDHPNPTTATIAYNALLIISNLESDLAAAERKMTKEALKTRPLAKLGWLDKVAVFEQVFCKILRAYDPYGRKIFQ